MFWRNLVPGVEPKGALGWVVAWGFRAVALSFRSQYEKVAGLLALQPEDDLLDVACGSGMFLKKYGAHVHGVAGLDHSEI